MPIGGAVIESGTKYAMLRKEWQRGKCKAEENQSGGRTVDRMEGGLTGTTLKNLSGNNY